MGIIPSTDEYGPNCLACFPAGKTPTTFKVFFTGIKVGAAWLPEYGFPPNGYHDVYQDPLEPCEWWKNKGDFPNILYRASNGTARLHYEVAFHKYAFGQSLAPVCTRFFTTEFDQPAIWPFYGGTGEVITPAEMARIVEKVTPMVDPDPRMECFPQADGITVIRYAGKRDGTNVYIEFDTDA